MRQEGEIDTDYEGDVEVPSMAAMDQQRSVIWPEIEAIVQSFRNKNLFSEDLPTNTAKLEPIKIELVNELPGIWPPKALQGAPRKQPFEYLKEIVLQTTELEKAGIIERNQNRSGICRGRLARGSYTIYSRQATRLAVGVSRSHSFLLRAHVTLDESYAVVRPTIRTIQSIVDSNLYTYNI